jgi:hypothetical protein
MARKCIKKFMVVNYHGVANNLPTASFTHSSPIMLPHFSKVDSSHHAKKREEELTLDSCLTKKRQRCLNTKLNVGIIFRLGKCIYSGLLYCLKACKDEVMGLDFNKCVAYCLQKFKIPSRAETCFEECYQKNIKKNEDTNHHQHP